MAIALASLAPITLVGYASTSNYAMAKVANGCMFAIAGLGGQIMIARHYRPLVAKNPKHRFGLAAWLILYMFVAIQMAWILRPFIGVPHMQTQFFR